MSRLMCMVVTALFVSVAHAQGTPGGAPAGDPACEAQMQGKDGKPLSGAAKKAALKKCKAGPMAESPAASSCEGKAVSKKTGKKLHGAAKQKFMEKCMRDGA